MSTATATRSSVRALAVVPNGLTSPRAMMRPEVTVATKLALSRPTSVAATVAIRNGTPGNRLKTERFEVSQPAAAGSITPSTRPSTTPPFAGDARSAADGRPVLDGCFPSSLHRSRGGQDTHGVPGGESVARDTVRIRGRAIGTPPDRSRVGIVGPATAHRPMPWRAAWMKRRRPTDP